MPEPKGRCFVVMPFGIKPAPDGAPVCFDEVYKDLLKPAIEAAGLRPHRADVDLRAGNIQGDMFQDLLLAEFVVADLTIDNPNVWYEIGVRHALRASGAVLAYALRDRLPFDLNNQRMIRYSLKDGAPDPDRLEAERRVLTAAIAATLEAWRGRKASPVYAMLPNLREPDWKSLRVGEVNEFWETLENWQSRIEIARRQQRPGDILTLAEETPNRLLAFEALRTAGDALLKMNRARYAMAVLERARSLNPEDVRARQLEAIALGRVEKHEQAAEALRRLAEEQKEAGQPSGETLGLLARTCKDSWRQLWDAQQSQGSDFLKAAKETQPSLANVASAYVEAFRAAPADFFPGINALTFGRLWEHVTGRRSRLPLNEVAQGLTWAIDCALTAKRDYWALASKAEHALVQGEADAAIEAFEAAAALAVETKDRFGLGSTGQQLRFLSALGFRPDIVPDALAAITAAEKQLDLLLGARPGRPSEPARVVLFSGHMVDRPGRQPARFPDGKADPAGSRIRAELDAIGADAGDLGICQAACGGDLLFARACLGRGMRLWVLLPQEEAAFLRDSVSWAGPRWVADYEAVRANADATFRVLPEELGPAPEGVGKYERCNRWMMHTALSQGLARVSFITLWDGGGGDGPGGTEHMVSLVRDLTGHEPAIIDPRTL
ncbi:tetratricopeptide repeat-containing protein [Sabulicella rubraurantiaca]|uniref:tetratricopeptide repeat-containing protein n=1 Tax=Sabulicella rubraurantiaca TaxID=2811429 RepID=UPI001A961114|nr:tetratricopeptide repeat-containing protein [Sabulicella rubraurantiaca]